MKSGLIGLLLTFQFFTSIPVRKQLPMNRQTVTAMYTLMPVIGLLMGLTIAFILFLNDHYFQFSTLFLAIMIVIANIVMTGGLHLDGWIDMGDAYFSYQDQKRRLEILEDSRVGAFGAISLVVLLILKIAFIFELLNSGKKELVIYLVVVPILCRLSMLLYFLTMESVKQKGLAAYFKSQVIHKKVWQAVIIYSMILLAALLYFSMPYLFILFGSMVGIVFLYRIWTKNHFGGMTGDLLGALYEGMELCLWGILLLFI
ncbi:adenosylcobinamide-GDP ribazoletransferase [Lysinibacillus antri]|uniref:Adenosylcobinamide-GDP ribazoletransferase n=1 Tax=Lysinibacillus antri TaxID=2498145 RepID=A0A3S0P8P5_9BACI|nr:adenosylcobinamide-GDP ribazoletransferase [Lysinibacillus antri]RUL57012.1 adenosylcobinamide-GDP ribazoletransferase [Lysinibacillus antri]